MNPQLYLTADLVHHNSQQQIQKLQQLQQQQQQQQQIIVNDVFEIPDETVPVPVPVSVPVENLKTQLPLALTNTANMNFIKAMNHTAMTDVMKQLATQKQKTPSVGTKQSNVSLQVPQNVLLLPEQQQPPSRAVSSPSVNDHGKLSHPATTAAAHLAAIPLSETGMNDGSGTTKKKYTTAKNSLNKKVIVEEEDRDSAIDYDDDDIEIKKTKLSLFQFAKDITFNLIFAIPFLQKARLHSMLRESTLAINQIERIFDEFKDRFSQFDLESIKKYICEDGIRDQLNFILETGFNKILSDGIIDVNDAPQFNQLVYYIIKSFNDINQGKVYRFYVSREHVMLLLHFVLKSVFSLTLKGQEEQMALGLLDTSFKLVQLEVLPIVSKRWYHRFRICKSAKQIEDIIE
jgi:hypothetical protein